MATSEDFLRLKYSDTLLFEMAPATELSLDARESDALIVEVLSGSVYVSTTSEHRGRILIRTPEAEIDAIWEMVHELVGLF